MNLSADEKALYAELAMRLRKEYFPGGPADICALGGVVERVRADEKGQGVRATQQYPEIALDRAVALEMEFRES